MNSPNRRSITGNWNDPRLDRLWKITRSDPIDRVELGSINEVTTSSGVIDDSLDELNHAQQT